VTGGQDEAARVAAQLQQQAEANPGYYGPRIAPDVPVRNSRFPRFTVALTLRIEHLGFFEGFAVLSCFVIIVEQTRAEWSVQGARFLRRGCRELACCQVLATPKLHAYCHGSCIEFGFLK